jgi:hypothetical protein
MTWWFSNVDAAVTAMTTETGAALAARVHARSWLTASRGRRLP